MSETTAHIYDLLGVQIGNLAVTGFEKDQWGYTITVDCVYTYPPEHKPFKLIFEDCRSCEWFLSKRKDQLPADKNIHILTHDLGQGNYQAPARIATVVVEMLISYRTVRVEKDW